MNFKIIFALVLGFALVSDAAEGACRRGRCGGPIRHLVRRILGVDGTEIRRRGMVSAPRQVQNPDTTKEKPAAKVVSEEDKKTTLKEYCVASLEKHAKATKNFGGSSAEEKEGAEKVLELLEDLKEKESFLQAENSKERLHQFLDSISKTFSGPTTDLPSEIIDLRRELKKFKQVLVNESLSDIQKQEAQMKALEGAVSALTSHATSKTMGDYAKNWLNCLQKKNCGEKIEQDARSASEQADSSGLLSPAAVKATEFLTVLKEIKGGFEEKSAEEYLHSFLAKMLKENGENQYEYWGEDPVLRLSRASDRASWSKFYSKTNAWHFDNATTRSLEGTIAPKFIRQQDQENFETLKQAVEGFEEVANLFAGEKDHTGLSLRANQWLACIQGAGQNLTPNPLPSLASTVLFNPDDVKHQEIIRALAKSVDNTMYGFSTANKVALAEKISIAFGLDFFAAWELADKYAAERESVPRFIQNWVK